MTLRNSLPLVLALVLVLPSLALAQKTDAGAWMAFAGQGSFSDVDPGAHWRWWLDTHLRLLEDSDGFETSIVRPGFGYQINKQTSAWLGYAWIHNDPLAGDFDEHRIWQQLIWTDTFDWGQPFLRTRLEQRFDDRGDDTGWRLRQFVRWAAPVSEGSSLSWRVWNEVFLDLNNTTWGQDVGLRQNRAFAGLGWKLDDAGRHTLEFGYLNQHIFRSGARDDSNHILSITLLSSF